MAKYLQLEGTRTPSVDLATGARVTVVDTPEARRKVAYGYVKIVREFEITDDPVPADEGGVRTIQAPAKNATRDDWVTFVGSLTHPTVPFDPADPDIGRNDLIALYEQWQAEQPGDAPEPA